MIQVELAAQVDVQNRLEMVNDYHTSQGNKKSDMTDGFI